MIWAGKITKGRKSHLKVRSIYFLARISLILNIYLINIYLVSIYSSIVFGIENMIMSKADMVFPNTVLRQVYCGRVERGPKYKSDSLENISYQNTT